MSHAGNLLHPEWTNSQIICLSNLHTINIYKRCIVLFAHPSSTCRFITVRGNAVTILLFIKVDERFFIQSLYPFTHSTVSIFSIKWKKSTIADISGKTPDKKKKTFILWRIQLISRINFFWWSLIYCWNHCFREPNRWENTRLTSALQRKSWAVVANRVTCTIASDMTLRGRRHLVPDALGVRTLQWLWPPNNASMKIPYCPNVGNVTASLPLELRFHRMGVMKSPLMR